MHPGAAARRTATERRRRVRVMFVARSVSSAVRIARSRSAGRRLGSDVRQHVRLAVCAGEERVGGRVVLRALARLVQREARAEGELLLLEVDAVRVEVLEQELAGGRQRARARALGQEILPAESAREALRGVAEVHEGARAHADLELGAEVLALPALAGRHPAREGVAALLPAVDLPARAVAGDRARFAADAQGPALAVHDHADLHAEELVHAGPPLALLRGAVARQAADLEEDRRGLEGVEQELRVGRLAVVVVAQ